MFDTLSLHTLIISHFTYPFSLERSFVLRNNHRYDDNHQQDYDANDYAHAHFHVLPPHLLPDSIGATAEALSRDSEVVSLVLESVESCTAIGNLVDVLTHYANSIIDLLLDSRSPLIAGRALSASTIAGNVRIVRLVGHFDGCNLREAGERRADDLWSFEDDDGWFGGEVAVVVVRAC